LDNAIHRRGDFKGIDQGLANAAIAGKKKFDIYYNLIKANPMFYLTAILNPRIKTN
jgi:hAT family C-terminal dimerisation region